MWLVAVASLPFVVHACVSAWFAATYAGIRVLGIALALFWYVGILAIARRALLIPLRTTANVIGGLRNNDYSLRAVSGSGSDGLDLVLFEVNQLADTLRTQRLRVLEANALLRTVMTEVDVVVLAFDGRRQLRLVNRAGEQFLGSPGERVLGCTADHLGLASLLDEHVPSTFERPAAIPGLDTNRRWHLRRTQFREGGQPHMLVVLTDVSGALRDEERLTWQRLIRVLSHEINNTLSPIKSLSDSLGEQMRRFPRPVGWETDVSNALALISNRSEALARFMGAYARLARLPEPQRRRFELGTAVQRAVELEQRVTVAMVGGADVFIDADPDQFEQLVINLVQNAADAVLAVGGADEPAVSISWRTPNGGLELDVCDSGTGLPPSQNLFVPFFSTKPGGSGIGLVLCRQIAERHGGTLSLRPRLRARGVCATLAIPRCVTPT